MSSLLPNNKQLPLKLLQDIQQLKNECEQFQKQNQDIVTIQHVPHSYTITLKDRDPESNFYFSVSEPRIENQKSIVNTYRRPHNQLSLSDSTVVTETDSVLPYIQSWLTLIRAYNSISLTPEDAFLKIYEQEYFDQFAMTDEDAATAPFSDRKQKELIYILELLEEQVSEFEEQDEATLEIIQESQHLKDNIQKLTKNEAIRWFSRITAKIKMKGHKFSSEIWGSVKKELIDYLVKKGVEAAVDGATTLLHHIHLIN